MAGSILLTGGGTAGHVTPNIALIEVLKSQGWEIAYVGSPTGIEQRLIGDMNIPFFGISTGKLRRYFSWQNFIDPFFILFGLLQSLVICLREKPDVVFSKGGFVAVPLVIAAWVCRIPVIIHESDITPGLANKICAPFARYICVNFEQTAAYLAGRKTVVTGSPMRTVLSSGNADKGLGYLGFDHTRPVLMIVGGSLGADAINQCIWQSLPQLLEVFQILHIVGKGNLKTDLEADGYVQKEYLDAEFGDVLAAADYVISRAGANSLYELLALRKPHLLIPLGLKASRGDQIVNAEIFQKAGLSMVLQESDLTTDKLIAALQELKHDDSYRQAINDFEVKDALAEIVGLIDRLAEKA